MTLLERLREFAKQEEPKDPNILICPFVAIERKELRALIEVAESALRARNEWTRYKTFDTGDVWDKDGDAYERYVRAADELNVALARLEAEV